MMSPFTQKALESLLQGITQSALSEGERLLRIRALRAGIEVVRGIRRLLLVQYVLNIACILLAIGILLTTWFVLEPLTQGRAIAFQFPLFFGLGLTLGAGALLALSVREKTWLQALDLDQQLDALSRPPAPIAPMAPAGPSPLSREELTQIVSELLDQKLAKPQPSHEPASGSPEIALK